MHFSKVSCRPAGNKQQQRGIMDAQLAALFGSCILAPHHDGQPKVAQACLQLGVRRTCAGKPNPSSSGLHRQHCQTRLVGRQKSLLLHLIDPAISCCAAH